MSLSVHGPAGDRTPAAFAAGYEWAPLRMEVQERKHTLKLGTFWSRQWGPPQGEEEKNRASSRLGGGTPIKPR